MSATNDKTYNGWTNYETWNVALWLSNDEGSYNYGRELADEVCSDIEEPETYATLDELRRFDLADRIQAWVEEMAPDLGASMFQDLLNAAMSEVNWHEIAESILSES